MSGYQDLSKYENYWDSLWGLHCMPGRTGTHNNEGLGPAIVLSGWWAIVMSLMLIMYGYFLNIVLNPSETEADIHKYRYILWRCCVYFSAVLSSRMGFHIQQYTACQIWPLAKLAAWSLNPGLPKGTWNPWRYWVVFKLLYPFSFVFLKPSTC